MARFSRLMTKVTMRRYAMKRQGSRNSIYPDHLGLLDIYPQAQ